MSGAHVPLGDTLAGLPEAPETAARAAPVAAGDIIAGKYEVGELLGSGGMGFVFVATHVKLKHKVAIKLLTADPEDTQAAERFAREAHIAAELTSEQVTHVMDLGTMPDGTSYIVMELLEGEDLAALLRSGARLSVKEAAGYILQACVAVAEAHARGVVHRDIKPGNLFLTHRADGSPLIKVLDFGISKRIVGADTRLTQTGSSVGSPLYMSPEQLRDSKNVDPGTDIWALAVVLYELICGVAPFESETLHETIARIAADPHPPLRELVADVPEELDALISRCLAKKREDRPENVAELARALAPFASPGAAAMYLPRVRGLGDRTSDLLAIERRAAIPDPAPAPASALPPGPSNTERMEVTGLRARIAAKDAEAAVGSRTDRGAWNTTSNPPPALKRRAALLVAVVVVALSALAVVVYVARRARARGPAPVAVATAAPVASVIAPPPPDPVEPRPMAIELPARPGTAATRAAPLEAGAPHAAHPPTPVALPPAGPRPRSKAPGVNDESFRGR